MNERTYDEDIEVEAHPPRGFERGYHKGVGTWADYLIYDAVTVIDGLVWRRTSFGGRDSRREREDWVLDLPDVGVSITRERGLPDGAWSKWNQWPNGGVTSMREAMRERVQLDLNGLDHEIEAVALKLGGLTVSRHAMQRFMVR